MAAINFTADMTALWAKTATDPAVAAMDVKHQSTAKEKNLLVLVDAIRAYMAELTSGQEARVARQMINRMAAEIMTSTGGYDTPSNITDASTRARDAALAYYQRGNIANLVEDANPVLDPAAILE